MPEKYIYYACGDKFVFGQAVYTGLDSLGRPGNYFFHNFLISEKDFRHFKYNPVSLVKYCIKAGLFKTSLPSAVQPLQIDTDMSRPPLSPVPDLRYRNTTYSSEGIWYYPSVCRRQYL